MHRLRRVSSRSSVPSFQLFRVVERHPVTGEFVVSVSLTLRDAEELADRCLASRPPQSRVLYAVEPMGR